MDFYMYKSSCPRWYGSENDIHHIVVSKDAGEEEVKEQAKQTANQLSGSKTCNIQLIQKYHMIIQPKKSYAALTHLTFHGQNAPYSLETLSEKKNED
jgi:hypothetical protein